MDWMPMWLAALAALGEALAGVGAVLPGEAALSAIGAASAPGEVGWIVLAAGAGACAGDQVNYGLGRRLGPRLRDTKLVRRVGVRQWDRGIDLVRRHGVWAVLGSRFVPVVRTLVPLAAGASRLTWVRFTTASAFGSFVWAAVWVAAGTAVAALPRPPVTSLLIAVVAVVLIAWRWRARRRRSGGVVGRGRELRQRLDSTGFRQDRC